MNLSRLRLLTFDVTDTLLKFKIAPSKQYGEIAARYGILCDPNSLATNFKIHWRKMQKEHPNYGLESGLGWEAWWREIINGTFKDVNENLDDKKLDEISKYLIHAYTTSNYWKHCYGALDLLSFLKHKGIILGVVSNFDPRLNKTLENAKLRHFFKFVLTSYEAGFEKPNPKIFEEAMKLSKLSNLKPEECMHVGDTDALDYQGAKSAGWQAALIVRDVRNVEEKPALSTSRHVYGTLFDLHKYFLNTSGDKMVFETKNIQ